MYMYKKLHNCHGKIPNEICKFDPKEINNYRLPYTAKTEV